MSEPQIEQPKKTNNVNPQDLEALRRFLDDKNDRETQPKRFVLPDPYECMRCHPRQDKQQLSFQPLDFGRFA